MFITSADRALTAFVHSHSEAFAVPAGPTHLVDHGVVGAVRRSPTLGLDAVEESTSEEQLATSAASAAVVVAAGHGTAHEACRF